MILILSFEADPHLTLVTSHLDAMGQAWLLLATDQVVCRRRRSTIDVDGVFVLCDDPSWRDLGTDGGASAVWNRRWLRPRLDNFADRGLVRHYAVEQWWYAVMGFSAGSPGYGSTRC